MTDYTSLTAPDLLLALSGRMLSDAHGRRHELAVRVYYEDTDFSGVAYHASYVRWCERGRSDFLRLAGNDHKALFDGSSGEEPAALMVRRLTIDYVRPAQIDDALVVTTRVKELAQATLTLEQHIVRLTPETTATKTEELCRAEVMVVLVSTSGRVQRIAKRLGHLFQP